MTGELLVIHPDATTALIPNQYDAIRTALGSYMDLCRGHGPVSAFVDDEGLLKNLRLNVVGSITLGRPVFGPVVLIAPEPDDEGETLPPDPNAVSAFQELASIWRSVLREALALGQDLRVSADVSKYPGPTIISLDHDEFGKWLETGMPPNLCPATGGEHAWTDDVDEMYSDRRSSHYIPPSERWHCEECGVKREEVNDG